MTDTTSAYPQLVIAQAMLRRALKATRSLLDNEYDDRVVGYTRVCEDTQSAIKAAVAAAKLEHEAEEKGPGLITDI